MVSMVMRLLLSPGGELGSTLMILRSRLFLKSKPCSGSATTWKLGVWLKELSCE